MKVGIGLGSNAGDRLLHLQRAKQYLLSLSADQWHRQSPLYETEPVGCPAGTPPFYNAALEIEFNGRPRSLLRKLLAYESSHGRTRKTETTTRTIDLDILYFGDLVVVEHDLVIPHPRLAQRRFVLVPLSTICPERIIAGTGKTVRLLLRQLPLSKGDIRLVRLDW
ncbi:MAG: 2-amino-4-hydroxy-6-hydroxymethyldihydropteridine diphosphokinase [Verrucomicrobiae bacterium]|nr:2-amino-4-hydroxy-6-hydroxymethyldihydropteridine diphosphokinase [Verrucomicrobiae bacterium]